MKLTHFTAEDGTIIPALSFDVDDSRIQEMKPKTGLMLFTYVSGDSDALVTGFHTVTASPTF